MVKLKKNQGRDFQRAHGVLFFVGRRGLTGKASVGAGNMRFLGVGGGSVGSSFIIRY